MDFLERLPIPRHLSSRVWLVSLPSALVSFEKRQKVAKMPIGGLRFLGLPVVAAGVGLAIGGTRFRVDAHGLVQIVRERRLKKRLAACFETACDRENPADALVDEDLSPDNGYQISNVGYPSISGGGRIWAGGLTLTVGL